MPFEQACIIGCGVMTGVGGVVRMARAEPGCTVAVIGCGAVGLNAIQGARLAGAATIIAVDLSDERLNVGRGFGATHVVNVSNGDSATQVRDLTQGRGTDYVIECAGNINAFRSSVEMVRPGGQVVWLGKVAADTEVSFCFSTLAGERHIVRSSYGNARPSRDFPWLVDQYLAGNLMLDELITQRIVLEEINYGFELMARGEGIRTVIRFN
jgi:S-(hydroxymethyl)glutathione dehydrogenase/alcohol dehydrogenase